MSLASRSSGLQAGGFLVWDSGLSNHVLAPFLYNTRTIHRAFRTSGYRNAQHQGTKTQKLRQTFKKPAYSRDDFENGESRQPRRSGHRRSNDLEPRRARQAPVNGSGTSRDFDLADRLFGPEKIERAMEVDTHSRQRQEEFPKDFVPFENDLGAHDESLRDKSTLSAKEKTTFEHLQRSTPSSRLSGEPIPHQLAGRIQKRSQRRPHSALDAILDEATMDAPPITNRELDKPARLVNTDLSSSTKRPTKRDASRIPRYILQQSREAMIEPVIKKLNLAKSDLEIWSVLENDVFETLRSLNLSESSTQDVQKPSPDRREAATVSLEVLGPVFSSLLVHVARALRTEFPTSPLLHAILPRIRQTGPSAFALGATIDLYNQCLAYYARPHTDVVAISDLLGEMEREVIEPDRATLNILSRCLAQGKEIRQGLHGDAARVFWGTDNVKRAVRGMNSRIEQIRLSVDQA